MNYKIQTNVPRDSLDVVRLAVGKAGAGVIGNYSYCAFVMPGTGYFLPMEGAHPVIGTIGQIEQVEEYRLEFVCEETKLSEVIKALRDSHPYEESPIEVLKLEDIR